MAMNDIELENAMLCWNRCGDVAVVVHPDTVGTSDGYQSSVGACFSNWRDLSPTDRKLQLLIDAWHIAAFYDVPATTVHEALLVIPEYRSMLADDCLPKRFQHEREA